MIFLVGKHCGSSCFRVFPVGRCCFVESLGASLAVREALSDETQVPSYLQIFWESSERGASTEIQGPPYIYIFWDNCERCTIIEVQ